MGLHTWFCKDKEIYKELEEIDNKLDKYDIGEIYLDELELLQLNSKADELYEKNKTEFHDIFRTSKREENGCYTKDVIYSREECLKWLENNKDKVFYGPASSAAQNKEECIKKLDEFWDKYPNGVIDFG